MMNRVAVRNVNRGEVVSTDVRLCRGFWSRLCGLLGTSELEGRRGCWIESCNSIHTFGMKYPIDAYFLNRQNQVIAVLKDLKPNRLSPIYFGAHSVLEFSSSAEKKCAVGDRFILEREASDTTKVA